MGERHATVLIVDDSPEDRLMYQRYLANTYAIYEAGLGASGLTLCQTLRPDCILLASWLPDGDGIGWIARLRASLGDLAPPVILLMAAGSEAMAVEAMQQGAQDALVKSQLTPELLQRAVRYASEMATLRRDLMVHDQQVQERTAALLAVEAERQRLIRVAQQAEHFAMLGRLAAGMSHEIRNPLGAIFLHVDLLEEELQGPSPEGSTLIAEALHEIKTQLGRLDELVQDYLSLVRIGNIQREVHDLGAAVQNWATEIRTQAVAHGVTVHCENLAELGQVVLHPSTLRRAVLNLVQNALDAMSQGGTLRLIGQRTASDIRLYIQDTGSGIPAAHLGQIFEPFYTTKTGGSGLGLSIVQEIIKAHEGTVTVESVEGQGSSFTLTLPCQAPGNTTEP